MKRISALILVLIVLGSGIFFTLQSEAQVAEKEAVKVPLNNYLQAHATGKAEFVRKAFHPDAKLFWYRDGKMMTRTAEEFASGFSGTPAPDEAQRKRNIDTIDISGNAAIAKITLDYPAVTFTDYMSLLKIDGEWKIVNKIFYAEPKSAPPAKPGE
ncbi:MAG TPA: nuclear transport factor 2 family protein [Pyrinomonadaceae bacterium]|jgi:hypothetical protein|nr:nuclear transport factor 2 family protein [Pyrinomonadaceae bacterium]